MGLGLTLVFPAGTVPAAADGWLSVAVFHPAFEDAAREQGIEKLANDCVVRRIDPADQGTEAPLPLHCAVLPTCQREASFSPGFVIVGAGPLPGRNCRYACQRGWLYRNEFLTSGMIEVREVGFRSTGRGTGPCGCLAEPECRQGMPAVEPVSGARDHHGDTTTTDPRMSGWNAHR